jgi:hypothetical protein
MPFLQIVGAVRQQRAEALADAVEARRHALIAFDLDRLAGARLGAKEIRPRHALFADHRRFGTTRKAPGFGRRAARVEPHGRSVGGEILGSDQHQALGRAERLETDLRVCQLGHEQQRRQY